MPTLPELLKLAKDSYTQARASRDPEAKRALVRLGDGYMKEADDLLQGRNVVQAVFPKPGSKIG
jgi:hypothetical protein